MLFRWGGGIGAFGGLERACACRGVEKRALGVLRDEGCMRGRMKDGRRSAIASLGLYIAAIFVAVVKCAQEAVEVRRLQAKAEAAARFHGALHCGGH
jgi:hypothetical protein